MRWAGLVALGAGGVGSVGSGTADVSGGGGGGTCLWGPAGTGQGPVRTETQADMSSSKPMAAGCEGGSAPEVAGRVLNLRQRRPDAVVGPMAALHSRAKRSPAALSRPPRLPTAGGSCNRQ